MTATAANVPDQLLGDVWPPRYLAEELWLRSRRQVALGLVERGRYLPAPQMVAMAERYQADGRRAWDRVLRGLPPPERAFLGSELVGGSASGVIAERAPLVLAFGDGVAATVCRLSTGREPDADPAFACGLINLLVSLFDLITDRTDDPVLDERGLDAVLEGPRGCELLKIEAGQLPLGAPRVFGLLLADLFIRLHQLAGAARDPSRWSAFEDAVRSAYAAQVQALARDKSVLPFRILGEVAAFAMSDDERHGGLALAEALGEVFWLTDDLADVASDWTTGDANSVIAGCGCGCERSAPEDWRGLTRVLDDGIDAASVRLLAAIDVATELMSGLAGSDRELDEATAWLTWYVVDWLR